MVTRSRHCHRPPLPSPTLNRTTSAGAAGCHLRRLSRWLPPAVRSRWAPLLLLALLPLAAWRGESRRLQNTSPSAGTPQLPFTHPPSLPFAAALPSPTAAAIPPPQPPPNVAMFNAAMPQPPHSHKRTPPSSAVTPSGALFSATAATAAAAANATNAAATNAAAAAANAAAAAITSAVVPSPSGQLIQTPPTRAPPPTTPIMTAFGSGGHTPVVPGSLPPNVRIVSADDVGNDGRGAGDGVGHSSGKVSADVSADIPGGNALDVSASTSVAEDAGVGNSRSSGSASNGATETSATEGGGQVPAAAMGDLIGPLVSGSVAGLAAQLPPNSTARMSSFALRIDDMAGLVVPKGYPLEHHVVVTGDGYKLGTFRIPYGIAGKGPGRRPPVLLIHGISLASTCWVVNQPRQSLGFILADQGYDVWMMNTRGNTFSRQHVRLQDTQSAFWRFAVDEMAHTDLRENIKYIQDVTGATKIALLGHSQGATIALMALADDPWLAESVSVLVALGPCAYVKHMTSVILKNFCQEANTSAVFRFLPPQELMYMSLQMQQTFLNGACQMPGTMVSCLTTMEAIFGTSRRITPAQYRRYWQIWPSSTSLGNALQWAEIYNEPKTRFFHKGYGQEYRLEDIMAPVVMISGGNDVLAAKEDVAEQKRRLSKVLRREYHIPDYSHMDFIWDTGAVRTLYPIILKALAESFA